MPRNGCEANGGVANDGCAYPDELIMEQGVSFNVRVSIKLHVEPLYIWAVETARRCLFLSPLCWAHNHNSQRHPVDKQTLVEEPMNCSALRHLLYAFPASFATLRMLLCERFELFTQSSMHVICHPYAEAADVAAAALVCIFRPQPYFLYFQELLPSFTVPHLLPYFRCFRWLLNAHAYCFTAILNHAAMLRFVFVFFCYWHPPAPMPMSSSYISYVRRCPFVHTFIQLCAEVLTQLPSMLAVVFFSLFI